MDWDESNTDRAWGCVVIIGLALLVLLIAVGGNGSEDAVTWPTPAGIILGGLVCALL